MDVSFHGFYKPNRMVYRSDYTYRREERLTDEEIRAYTVIYVHERTYHLILGNTGWKCNQNYQTKPNRLRRPPENADSDSDSD
jgi:hypothetical protein